MPILAFIIALTLYSAPLFAQDLSSNPWVEQNTEEQISSVYEKRNKKLGTQSASSPNLPQNYTSSPSPFDKLKSFFSSDNSPQSPQTETLIPKKRITRPQKIASKRRARKTNYALTPSGPTDPAISKESAFSLPDFDMPSMPSFGSNSLINQTKRNFQKSLQTIKKQLR